MIERAGSPSRIRLVSQESVYGPSYEDVERRVPDVTRMREILGVETEVDLHEGLGRTIDWFRKVPGLVTV
jgi:UDP-glucose 4-epimerase